MGRGKNRKNYDQVAKTGHKFYTVEKRFCAIVRPYPVSHDSALNMEITPLGTSTFCDEQRSGVFVVCLQLALRVDV